MNVVMIVPTGIGCEIGGHAGDATPAARLLGACCDNLILHPNVVNASDINEMPENAWYVEGGFLDRFLEGKIGLSRVAYNRILVVVNKPVLNETMNAVSAARATMGIDTKMLVLDTPLELIARFNSDGSAAGDVHGWEALCEQVSAYDFDALAITTPITCPEDVQLKYFNEGGVNPWGGVEAIASRLISYRLNIPVAHAPVALPKENLVLQEYNKIVDPRASAELVSIAYLFCILKGLYTAPQIGGDLSVKNIDLMVSPECWGRPHDACWNNDVPILFVRENKTVYSHAFGWPVDKDCILVENYLEACGVITVMKAGITMESVRRPLAPTEIING